MNVNNNIVNKYIKLQHHHIGTYSAVEILENHHIGTHSIVNIIQRRVAPSPPPCLFHSMTAWYGKNGVIEKVVAQPMCRKMVVAGSSANYV